MEVWGGIECSVNRVGNSYFDQLEYSGHYDRHTDIDELIALGIKKIRYPVLWETHQPHIDEPANWLPTADKLQQLRANGIEVIAGLVHHGSGPAYVNIAEDSFVTGLAAYAAAVAEKFPWITYYTPVNEPLTTARFCGLYGIWHPHQNNDKSFCRILVNECKATVLAMQAIRKINPNAKLVQTDDLGKIHSTPLLQYQANFENERRWLSYDLLCGIVNENHILWRYLLENDIKEEELQFFTENKCAPDVLGINHYLTSERYLDENLGIYGSHTHGGNGRYRYADVEAVRVGHICPDGPYKLLKEAWQRYRLPMAVTEVHLYCTREEQMRWLSLIWNVGNQLEKEGVAMLAITAWALTGSFGWNRLLTMPNGDYEPGVFDLAEGKLRPTALAGMIKAYNQHGDFHHPVLNNKGWWQRKCRVIYGNELFFNEDATHNQQPLVLTGKRNALLHEFEHKCRLRGIAYHYLDIQQLGFAAMESALLSLQPWAVINTAGMANNENDLSVNSQGIAELAAFCKKRHIKLLTFSADVAITRFMNDPEQDQLPSFIVYEQHKALAEIKLLTQNPHTLIICANQVDFSEGQQMMIADGPHQNPVSTHMPEIVDTSLDLLLDNESGVWYLNNSEKTFSKKAAALLSQPYNGKKQIRVNAA